MHPSPYPGWTPLSTVSASAGAGPSSMVPPAESATATPANRNHRRLPPEAYKILRDYFNVNQYPSRAEKEQLVKRIRGLPGCEDYNLKRLSLYMNQRRQARKSSENVPSPSMTSAHILYPSLARDPVLIEKLEVLLKEHPNPPPEVAAIWATRIGVGVVADDILTYARLQRAQSGSADPNPNINSNTNPNPITNTNAAASVPSVPRMQLPPLPPFQREPPPRSTRPRSQLPTPASSTSPEPRSPVFQTGYRAQVPIPGHAVEEEEDYEMDEEEVKDELDSEDEIRE
ncbi:hypothetical protein C8Q76DRAFT_692177 [Earliella scabrosa]|nr:hypothetical protein C8Q76DRAFT_692177 [Earliella scabrosa]